ncbi:hypothetical protein ACWCP6_23640 [Streptomyces sp. NPDC002004]
MLLGRPASGKGKTRFDDIYTRPDPRAFFRRLAPLAYEIPHHAQSVFRRTRSARSAAEGGAPVTVLDVACSYGINAALLNHDLTLADLFAHYTGPGVRDLGVDELIAHDREFYAAHRREDAGPVIGLDASEQAVHYALAVGLLDEGYAENLERTPPSPGLRAAMAKTGLITATGAGSYVTDRTFRALLDCARRPVWISAFVLRTVPYDAVVEALAGYGLTTVRDDEHTYPQRRFTDAAEQRHAVASVRRNGEDPTGREAEGRYHARLYASRPADTRPGGPAASGSDGPP